jgi:hypothetical protein
MKINPTIRERLEQVFLWSAIAMLTVLLVITLARR